MKIYIASSWKNQHAVEMLTTLLENELGHDVESFVRNCGEEEQKKGFDIEEWIASEDGRNKFLYDTKWAMESDLVIYISPSGTDAWAEVGAAFGRGNTIFGLYAKGEQSGLMRRMVSRWFSDYGELLDAVHEYSKEGGV